MEPSQHSWDSEMLSTTDTCGHVASRQERVRGKREGRGREGEGDRERPRALD